MSDTKPQSKRQNLTEARHKLDSLNSERQAIVQRILELSRSNIEQEAEQIINGQPLDTIGPNRAEIETLQHRCQVLDRAINSQQE